MKVYKVKEKTELNENIRTFCYRKIVAKWLELRLLYKLHGYLHIVVRSSCVSKSALFLHCLHVNPYIYLWLILTKYFTFSYSKEITTRTYHSSDENIHNFCAFSHCSSFFARKLVGCGVVFDLLDASTFHYFRNRTHSVVNGKV